MLKPNLRNIQVHRATCSCSIELYKQCFTLADFCQTGIFAGFSLYIINFVGRISEAAIAGDIFLISLGDQVRDYTGAHTVIFRGIFSIYYKLFARRNSEAVMGGSGVGGRGGGHYFFRVPK